MQTIWERVLLNISGKPCPGKGEIDLQVYNVITTPTISARTNERIVPLPLPAIRILGVNETMLVIIFIKIK